MMTVSLMTTASIPEQKIQDGKPFPKVYMPSSLSKDSQNCVRGNKIQDGKPFPKVYMPSSLSKDSQNCVRGNIELISKELREHGAILFRGFGLSSAQDFNDFVEAFGWEEKLYQGAASRVNVLGRVYTANEAPLDHHIFFHHEMALMKEVPSKLFFFCEVAPPKGGETAIVQSHRVAAHMQSTFPKMVNELDKKGIITCTPMPKADNYNFFLGKSWQSFLGTRDLQEAEKKVESTGSKIEWMEDGSANIIRGPLSATRTFNGYNGRRVWFNYIPAATYKNAGSINKLYMGDGSEIPSELYEESARIMDCDCVEIKWEKGDVLLLDNLAVMHARRPSLPPRRVLVAMCK